MGLTESYQSVKDAHAAKYGVDSIFADSIAISPSGEGNFTASVSVPEGRVEATAATPEGALDALALDIEEVAPGDARRDAMKQADLTKKKARAEAEAQRLADELAALEQ